MNQLYHITVGNRKNKYGAVSNLIFYLKLLWEWDKLAFAAPFLMVVPYVAQSILSVLMPASLVRGLENKNSITDILVEFAWIAAGLLIATSLYTAFERIIISGTRYASLLALKPFMAKFPELDYGRMEEAEFRTVYDNAWGTANNGNGFAVMSEGIALLLSKGIAVAAYGVLMSMQSVLLLGLAAISACVDFWLLSIARKKHRQYYGKIAKYAKGEQYITEQSMDSSAGKDIRIFHMSEFFLKKYDSHLAEIGNLYNRIHRWYLFRSGAGAIFRLVRNAFAYIYMIYQLVKGSVSAAEFVFFIGILTEFSDYLKNFLDQIMIISKGSTSISYFREFLDEESSWRKESGVDEEALRRMKQEAVTLELKNITYTYPGNEKPTIENLNLTLRKGEKLALIGLNGAGKTTLVKLICGLYTPDEGEILINGIPRTEFTKEQYYSLVSVLFQDSQVLPRTLDENIAGTKDIDRERLKDALQCAGFAEKYDSLPRKGDTMLVKIIEENATDFSGGERQKFMFARALYKDAPLVILDEPTAALDPIAENELYMNFGEAVKNRTSIYISHRLSSTRFCDRIILLENGRILEEGTHDTLMGQKSRYAELFEEQSRYYRDEEKKRQGRIIMGDEEGTYDKG